MKTEIFSVDSLTTNHDEILAAFVPASGQIWKEESASQRIDPYKLKNGLKYMPWGADNNMPYEILDKIESDETINTCQQHNIKNCYAAIRSFILG